MCIGHIELNQIGEMLRH